MTFLETSQSLFPTFNAFYTFFRDHSDTWHNQVGDWIKACMRKFNLNTADKCWKFFVEDQEIHFGNDVTKWGDKEAELFCDCLNDSYSCY